MLRHTVLIYYRIFDTEYMSAIAYLPFILQPQDHIGKINKMIYLLVISILKEFIAFYNEAYIY